MASNLTERVTRMSALVLGVAPEATPDQIISRLTVLTGSGSSWLPKGARALPTDPYQGRVVAAARVLTADAQDRSGAVVRFLAADSKLPEIDRMAPPVPDSPTGLQLKLAL